MKLCVKQFFILLFMMALVTGACNKTSEAGSAEMISGQTSKTWKAERETNAAGEKDKLTSEEKRQRIQFFANGKYNMTSAADNRSGTWNYDPANSTLTLQTEGEGTSMAFQVLSLSNDEMTLKAADGSTMQLEAE